MHGQFIIEGILSLKERYYIILLGESCGYSVTDSSVLERTENLPIVFVNTLIHWFNGQAWLASYRRMSYEEAIEELKSYIKEGYNADYKISLP
jgi:hypothetical protein